LQGILHSIFRHKTQSAGLSFSRPLVFLQSDDWGRVGVRDREGFEQLRASGLRLGEHPYDLYSLETAADVSSLACSLGRHHDSSGRPPCLVMNFCVANLDFPKMRVLGFKSIEWLNLASGLPGRWSRPGLFEAYRQGIQQGMFYPAMHGLTHFCPVAAENALSENGERARLLRLLWDAETPYIYWRMPWIGYEYWNPERPHAGFLPYKRQQSLVQKSCAAFSAFFGRRPLSACAAGYRANRDTHQAWAECGIRVVQNGSGSGLKSPYMDELGLLHLYRAIDLEPAQKEVETEKYLEIAANCVARGMPIVISIHAVNFHSSIKDFRTPTLVALDALLKALESKYPDLLYVNDEDLYELVNEGTLRGRTQHVAVSAAPEGGATVAQGAV
jgi:hypothetical protein